MGIPTKGLGTGPAFEAKAQVELPPSLREGEHVSVPLVVTNQNAAPAGWKPNWSLLGRSGTHVGATITPATKDSPAVLQLTGGTAGSDQIGLEFVNKYFTDSNSYTYLKRSWTVTTKTRQQAAHDNLAGLNERRLGVQDGSGSWTEADTKKQVGAELEAIDAADDAINKASPSRGSHPETGLVMSRILEDIGRIEAARSLGYTDAVTFLASGALDTPSNVRSFGLSLAGNLIWAMSSFIPVAGAFKGASIFAKLVGGEKGKGYVAAGLGVAGAMLAQFSNGLPSGGRDVSAILDQLKATLKTANSVLADNHRAAAFMEISNLMSGEPPKPGMDRAGYLSDLESALRYNLFGEIFAKKLNDGARPMGSKVEAEAKRAMLSAAAAPAADVTSDGKAEVTTPYLDDPLAKKIVSKVSQAGQPVFETYDLVGTRVGVAAQALGCRAEIDPLEVNEAMAQGKVLEIPVSSWSWRASPLSREGNNHLPLWNELFAAGRIETFPKFSLGFALDGESIRNIDSITIYPAYVSNKKLNGKDVKTLDRVVFSAAGGEHFSGSFRGSSPPAKFKILYNLSD